MVAPSHWRREPCSRLSRRAVLQSMQSVNMLYAEELASSAFRQALLRAGAVGAADTMLDVDTTKTDELGAQDGRAARLGRTWHSRLLVSAARRVLGTCENCEQTPKGLQRAGWHCKCRKAQASHWSRGCREWP